MAYRYTTTTSGVALAAATAQTIVQLSTLSTSRCTIWGWTFSLEDDLTTPDPTLCEVLRQTGGTGATTTEIPLDPNAPASLTVAKDTFSVEPTPGDVLDAAYVHPNAGAWAVQLSVPVILDVSDLVGFRCTSATGSTPNAAVSVYYED